MKKHLWLLVKIFLIVELSTPAFSLPPIEGEVFSLYPITNEVSFYQNVDDAGTNRGQTIQIISVNSFKLLTDFTFEFTADFNWSMSELDKDNYIEMSVVKPIYNIVSVNYQRIYATYESEPINQFGIRLSF